MRMSVVYKYVPIYKTRTKTGVSKFVPSFLRALIFSAHNIQQTNYNIPLLLCQVLTVYILIIMGSISLPVISMTA